MLDAEGGGGARRRRWLAPSGCGLLGGLMFAPAVRSGRLADDYTLLRTVQSVTTVVSPFTHNDLGQAAGSGHFYRPLWVLWNAALYQLTHSPALAHVMNFVLFGVICAEVVLLVRRLADDRTAVIAGALFAVFPSHGESVAWISGNTDLLAVALGLPALILGLGGSGGRRTVAIACFAAASMLSKEIAIVLPVLMALLLWLRPAGDDGARCFRYWQPVLTMAITIVAVAAVRVAVVNGAGGYGPTLTAKRVGGSLVSFTAAAFSAPQLALAQHPVLLAIPAAALLSVLLAVWAPRRGDQRSQTRLAVLGVVWFGVSLLPVLNQPLNLNTRNGDRLLLLPSVGLVLAVAVLVARTRNRLLRAGVGVVGVLCAASCLANGADWRTAGIESRRLLADIERLAPRDAHVIALSVPTDYKAAHLFPDSLDIALQESGRPDLTLTACAPVHPLQLSPGQISFRLVGVIWEGRATDRAPFDVPVLSPSIVLDRPSCIFDRAPGHPVTGLGTTLMAVVRAFPARTGTTAIMYFDGRDMRLATAPIDAGP